MVIEETRAESARKWTYWLLKSWTWFDACNASESAKKITVDSQEEVKTCNWENA